MKYITIFILLILLLFVAIGCNTKKKIQKYNADVKEGVEYYINTHPCVNDTITITKSDTVTTTETKYDTVIERKDSTVYVNVTKTNTVTKLIHDTITNTVTDNQQINFLKSQLNTATNENKAITATLAKETIESKDWEHKAKTRYFLWIGTIVAFGIWTFRKPLLKLIA